MEQPRLLDRVREAIRVRHFSLRTEQSYIQWIRRFILFHGKRHPDTMGEKEISSFLSHLAVDRKVSASTQNQALSAILFLYQKVLEHKLDWLEDVVRAKRPRRLPVVLTQSEVGALLAQIDGINGLVARLLYGTGMRQMECLRLRVKDVDFHYRQIHVRSGKSDKDRVTILPDRLVDDLKFHINKAFQLHQRDLSEGFGETRLPHALSRKYPNAGREWGWQFVFPSNHRSEDPCCGTIRRHHWYHTNLHRAIKQAARTINLTKPVSSHTLRHSFATHLIENG